MTSQVEVSALLKPLFDVYRLLSDEWKNLFDIGLADYLQSQTEKYYFTNTFIHRSEKVRFTDIYYPVKSTYKFLSTDFDNVDEIFDEYRNITIVGLAGSGKTTLLKNIFLKTIESHERIPVLIELRNLNEYNGDLEKLISEKILKSKLLPSDAIFQRTLQSGKFLFLLDGYDEIFSVKKQEINRQIEMFVDNYSKNTFLITTRPGSGIEGFPRFYDFKVCALEDSDVIGFITKIVEEEERRKRVISIINDPKNSNYLKYLRNPLLLSMFIMAFESHPEIPQRKNAFYRNVFDTLYSKHDGLTKNSFPREKLTKLQRDNFENVLSVFSYLTLLEGQYTFTSEYLSDVLSKVKRINEYSFSVEDLIYDLRTSISILILDGFEYYFPHRSMQEYFAALFLSKLPTDRKNQAYNNLLGVLQRSSTDNSFNFWNLCLEVDETAFISNFLIPQLKKIQKRLFNKDGKELMIAFSSVVKPVLINYNRKNENPDMGIARHHTLGESLLSFCGIHDYQKIWRFPKNSGCDLKLLNIYNEERAKAKENTSIALEIDKSNDIMAVLEENGFVELIKNILHSLDQKINDLETLNKKRKENIDDLLRI